MATFHLKVLTVDKQFFDGEVDRIVVRTSQAMWASCRTMCRMLRRSASAV